MMPPAKPSALLIVISAPSGCGKTTLVNRLLARNSNLERSVSATTRRARKGEVDGRDYIFVSERQFLENRKRRVFLESARVFGHHYGTFKKTVLAKLGKGKDVVLAIDVQGARRLKKKIKGIFIFLMPPSMQDLEKRLVDRKRDTKREIEVRLERARAEIRCAKDYDYVVTNREVSETIREIEKILLKEKKKRGFAGSNHWSRSRAAGRRFTGRNARREKLNIA